MRSTKKHDHLSTSAHANNKLFYKWDNIEKQFEDYISEKSNGNPTDENLLWEKFRKARIAGYFNRYDADDTIDFIHYEFYFRHFYQNPC